MAARSCCWRQQRSKSQVRGGFRVRFRRDYSAQSAAVLLGCRCRLAHGTGWNRDGAGGRERGRRVRGARGAAGGAGAARAHTHARGQLLVFGGVGRWGRGRVGGLAKPRRGASDGQNKRVSAGEDDSEERADGGGSEGLSPGERPPGQAPPWSHRKVTMSRLSTQSWWSSGPFLVFRRSR